MALDQAILIVVCEDENVKVKIRQSKREHNHRAYYCGGSALHLNVPHTLSKET